MGFAGDMFGGGSSSRGTGFQGSGVTQGQINTAYDQTQAGIKQQQDFVNALAGQNGLANQSSVFGQQQGLANQLQGVANGTGPNPALAQLNQQTGRNVANQAALMASQRGANQNVGLMARQAANQGANLQQQAVGQGATLQAQQQLAAMQQLQNQQANMGNMANTQVGQQATGIQNLNQNSLQQQANLLGMQANINSANAGIAGVNTQGQQNMMGNLMGAVGSVGNLFGGKGSGGGGGLGGLFSGAGSGGVAGGAGDLVGGGSDMAGGAGSMFEGAGTMLAAEGGEVTPQNLNQGNAFDPLMQSAPAPQVQIQTPVQPQAPVAPVGPISNVGKMFAGDTQAQPMPKGSGGGAGAPPELSKMATTTEDGKTTTHLSKEYLDQQVADADKARHKERNQDFMGKAVGAMGSLVGTAFGAPQAGGFIGKFAGKGIGGLMGAEGGQVPALLSPGEVRIHAKDVSKVASGQKSPMSGEKIPGKPKVDGAKNSYSNDTVRKNLNEGDIILPRSVTQSKDPAQAAHAFVSAILAKNGKSLPKKSK